MGVLRNSSGFQTSAEVKMWDSRLVSGGEKVLAGARQETANEHPPTRVLPFRLTCHATSRVTVTLCVTQCHAVCNTMSRFVSCVNFIFLNTQIKSSVYFLKSDFDSADILFFNLSNSSCRISCLSFSMSGCGDDFFWLKFFVRCMRTVSLRAM